MNTVITVTFSECVAVPSQDIHKELEEKIARFHGKDDAILYIACFDANAGIFEALLTPEDAVISDQLNHASIIDGIRLCKARKYRYKNSGVSVWAGD